MKTTRLLLPLSLLLIFSLAVATSSLTAQPTAKLPWQREKIAPGLVWQSVRTDQLYGSKQSINLLKVNTRKRQLSLAYVTDTLVRTSDLAQAGKALAAINAGFFKIKEGAGSAAYLRVAGQTIDDLPVEQDRKSLLNGALLLSDEGKAGIEYARSREAYNSFESDQTVLVTGPVLILDGNKQPLADDAFNSNRHPRTCACLLRRNKVLLLTVDGRNAEAQGMSLPELSDLLRSLGCKAAINLDGGGSTTMWISGKPDNGVVNYPSDNKLFDHFGERPVANAVLVE